MDDENPGNCCSSLTSLARPVFFFFGKSSLVSDYLKSISKSSKSCHKATKVYVMLSHIESFQRYSSFTASADGVCVPMESL